MNTEMQNKEGGLTLREFLTFNTAKIQALDGDKLYKLKKTCDLVSKVAKIVETETMTRLEAGHDVGNFELVPKRPTRRWIDEAAVLEKYEALLGDDLFNATIKTPAQLEKALKEYDERLDKGLFESKSSGTKLAEKEDISDLLGG